MAGMLRCALQARLVPTVCAVDLYCGAGGFTHGLSMSGVKVVAGMDTDEHAKYAYEANNQGARFIRAHPESLTAEQLGEMFEPGTVRLLVTRLRPWGWIGDIDRLVKGVMPELLAIEWQPWPGTAGTAAAASRLSRALTDLGYYVDAAHVAWVKYGIPQVRVRMLTLASRLGQIYVPPGNCWDPSQWRTVRDAIGDLPPLSAGQRDDSGDAAHVAPRISDYVLIRAQGSRKLLWDRPAPAIPTRYSALVIGKYLHPEQDRVITPREVALLYSFPRTYAFCPPDQRFVRNHVVRLIGESVPPELARQLGETLVEHVASPSESKWQLVPRLSG